ncbi:monooxygenase [Lojkania enalia]|uniref:Monooxygenase n=1 Tax=Lojkania enalia TaxID=147567 RepID=A0A9P4N593_9PLEO|nr:monooxygenase [Didymosphaeria enalia]
MISSNSHTKTNGTSTGLPIVIAGGGCVGLFLALLLCQSPIRNKVIVVEPNLPNATDTRAMAHQPLIFPLFACAGLLPELSKLGSFSSGICFRKSVANGSELIAGKQFKEGEKAQLLLPQWKFQGLLIGKVKQEDKGDVRMGWKISSFQDKEKSVSVKIVGEGGKEEEIKADYLIGADGAKSTVRKLLGAEFEGETLDAQLVATDIVFDFHRHGFYDANFVIDPVDYGLIGRIDNEGLWRVSYGVPRSATEEQIFEGVHEKLAKMLPGEGKDEDGERKYEVRRIAPYKAQQRCAETFWKGRVGICGDAAHLTNPYAGLGLASGIADAAALSEVLVQILTNKAAAPVQLLSSWSEARRQKFLNAVSQPSRMAYMRVRRNVDSQENVDMMLERDPLVKALKTGMPMMPPSLVTNVQELEGWA